MAIRRNFNKYQYETSPKKLEPEYPYTKNPYKIKKTTTKPSKKIEKTKKKKSKIKFVLYIAILGTIVFFVSFRNIQINESFANIQNLKQDLSEIEKENQQLKVIIEGSVNLANIKKLAEEKLGMQKLDEDQKVYVNLSKRDYIERPVEEIKLKEEITFLQRIKNFIMNINK